MLRIGCLAIALAAAGTAAGNPITLTHQARLLDAAGDPMEGTLDVEISLWRDANSDDEAQRLWLASYPAATVANGYRAFILEVADNGDVIDNAWFTGDVWVQVAVDGSPLRPRSPVTDVPGASLGVASTTVSRPTRPVEGQMWFDTSARILEVFVGEEWVPVLANDPSAASCSELRAQGNVASGTYTVDPDGSGGATAFDVYCEMTVDDGGWTRVFVSTTNNYNTSTIAYPPNVSGNNSIIARSSEMMFAYTNPSTGSLTQAWTFPTPSQFHSVTPMASAQCTYINTTVTRLADNTSRAGAIRTGWGSFGRFCDDSCSSTWGQICFKSNTSQGGGGGFSDFPHFTGYSNANTDWCAQSNQDYRDAGNCNDAKRFTILVR